MDDKGQPIKDANGKDMTNKEVLDMWNEEHQYVDIGLGFKLDGNGEVIPSTAFDSAISGIGIMGYGVDADGDPKNLASIMLRLADIFEGYDHETQTWNVGSRSEAEELLKKLDASREAMGEKWTTLDTEANFLDKNGTQLENTYDALNVERATWRTRPGGRHSGACMGPNLLQCRPSSGHQCDSSVPDGLYEVISILCTERSTSQCVP